MVGPAWVVVAFVFPTHFFAGTPHCASPSQSFFWMAPPNSRVFTSSILPPGGLLDPPTTPLLPGGGAGVIELNRPVIIVIVVLALVGSFIILALLFKCLFGPKSSPLPPKQPLAHHRGTESKYLPRPHFPRKSMRFNQADWYGSDTSSSGPSRMASFRTVDSSVTLSPSYRSSWIPTLPKIEGSGQLSVQFNSDDHFSTTQYHVSTARLARSASLFRSRQQLSPKGSMASSRSVSTRSVNTIRGAPHSPYSNIQIVLPVPLAPQLRGHMVTDPSVVQSGRGLLELGCTADQWMAVPIRTTSWHPRSDQSLSVVDVSPGRETGLRFGQKCHRSSDNVDHLRRPESQTWPRWRTSSHNPLQRRSLGLGDFMSSPQPLDDQSQSFRADFRDPRDGQAVRQPVEQLNQSPGCAEEKLPRQPPSFPRHDRCLSNISNLPLPKSAAHPRHFYTPSWDEQPPPPVPPSLQLPQVLLCKPDTCHFFDGSGTHDFSGPTTRAAGYPTNTPSPIGPPKNITHPHPSYF